MEFVHQRDQVGGYRWCGVSRPVEDLMGVEQLCGHEAEGVCEQGVCAMLWSMTTEVEALAAILLFHGAAARPE